MHMMAAAAFKAQELALSPDEAKELAEKIAEVQKHYPAAVFDPKYAAIGALVFAVVKIEGPRALYLMNRPKNQGGE